MEKNFVQNNVTQRFILAYENLKKLKRFNSQKELVERMKYKRQALYLVLNGKRDIPLSILDNFISEFNLDANQFFSNDKRPIIKIYNPSNDKLEHYSVGDDIQENNLRCYEVSNNHFAPEIKKGDWILCSEVPVKMSINDNRLYIFHTSDEISIHRLLSYNNNKKSFTICNSIDAKQSTEILENNINEIWKLEKVIRTCEDIDFNMENRLSRLEQIIYKKNTKH
jgi:transcriptional regulator with XRE-family HTH domain